MISAAKYSLYHALLLFQCTKHGNIKVLCHVFFIDYVCKVSGISCLLSLSCLNHKFISEILLNRAVKQLMHVWRHHLL